MANRFVLNETSYHGSGAINHIPEEIQRRGFKKVFVCTDPDLIKFNVASKVTTLLDAANIDYVVFSEVKANPTIENVLAGVKAFKDAGCDSIVAIGGGSSMENTVFRLGCGGSPGISKEKVRKSDFPNGGNTGNHQIARDHQNTADGYKAKDQKDAMDDAFKQIRFLHSSCTSSPLLRGGCIV